MISIIASLIPLLIIILIFYIMKIKIEDFSNLWFWGIISLILTFIINYIPDLYIPDLNFYYNYGNYFYRFIAIFIMFGFSEELAKYLSVKFSKPSSKFQNFSHTIIIATIFTIYEDLAYIEQSQNIIRTALFRILTPAHIAFSIIMSYFLMKAYDKKQEKQPLKKYGYEILAIIIPAIIHSIFDYIVSKIKLNILLIIILAIIIYTFIILIFINYKKYYNQNETNKAPKNKIFKFIQYLLIVAFTLFYLYSFLTY